MTAGLYSFNTVLLIYYPLIKFLFPLLTLFLHSQVSAIG